MAKRYVGLEEFEGIKATLAHELVPTRRHFMSEYRPPVAAEAPEAPEVSVPPPVAEQGPKAVSKKAPRPDAVQLWLAAKAHGLLICCNIFYVFIII